jgi:hypothetical protein
MKIGPEVRGSSASPGIATGRSVERTEVRDYLSALDAAANRFNLI